MRIQTWHLLECQSCWRNLTVDLPPTRKGLTALQATFNINISHIRFPATRIKAKEINVMVI
jgi:hypothetical protein